MDFLDPAKKKARIRRLYIGYFLFGASILTISIILFVLSYGYFYDRKTGQVIQNGLIFTASAPESAKITLNGKDNGETDKRLTVPAGTYTIELSRSGYRTWKKTVQLDGGNIERLVYPRLFPSKLETAAAQTYTSAPSFSAQSPDRRWIVVAQPGQFNLFDVYDTANPNDPAKTVTLSPDVLTKPVAGAAESLTLVEWSTDNRHILVKHTYGDAYEFVVIDRAEEQVSYNVNKASGINPAKAVLRDKKYDKLYVYTADAKQLQSFELKDKALTPLLSNVLNFKPYADKTILYTTEDPVQPGKVLLRILDNGKSYGLRTFSDAGDVLLELANYDGDQYVAAASTKEGRLYVYKDPLAKLTQNSKTQLTPFVLIRFAGPAKLTFSSNTRFISMQAGTKFAVYDLEENRRYNFTLPGELPPETFASWMDGHRLVVNQANKVQTVEFDGANQQELGAIIPGTLPFFDRDYERLYTLSPVVDQSAVTLTRTSLKLKLKP